MAIHTSDKVYYDTTRHALVLHAVRPSAHHIAQGMGLRRSLMPNARLPPSAHMLMRDGVVIPHNIDADEPEKTLMFEHRCTYFMFLTALISVSTL